MNRNQAGKALINPLTMVYNVPCGKYESGISKKKLNFNPI